VIAAGVPTGLEGTVVVDEVSFDDDNSDADEMDSEPEGVDGALAVGEAGGDGAGDAEPDDGGDDDNDDDDE